VNGSRITPPAARHLLDDAAKLHREVSMRDEVSHGSAHIKDARALADTLTTLAQALDLVPTVIGHLTDHLTAWRDADRLTLAEGAHHADTAQVCAAAFIAAREAIPALERGTRALRVMADSLTGLAPNKPAPDPADEDWRPDTGWTGHQRIAYLRKRLQWHLPAWTDRGGLDSDWRRIVFSALAALLAEGRTSEATHLLLRDLPDPGPRAQMAAELVAVAELLISVTLVEEGVLKAADPTGQAGEK
jgi:hypothetical protein